MSDQDKASIVLIMMVRKRQSNKRKRDAPEEEQEEDFINEVTNLSKLQVALIVIEYLKLPESSRINSLVLDELSVKLSLIAVEKKVLCINFSLYFL